jgi:hypothetical protein
MSRPYKGPALWNKRFSSTQPNLNFTFFCLFSLSVKGQQQHDHLSANQHPRMQLTVEAIAMLTQGAHSPSQDDNAISAIGKVFHAGQVQCEDDPKLRKRMGIEEFQPVLEVRELVWLGTWSKFPRINIIVTDGLMSMEMRIGQRSPQARSAIFRKNGPLFSGKLNIGKRFRLLDYTTVMEKGKPMILLERIRAAPKRTSAKILSSLVVAATQLNL